MSYRSLCSFLEVSEERLFGAIREGWAESWSGLKERLKHYDKEMQEKDEELEAVRAENALLRQAERATDEEVLRRKRALPIDFIEQYAKECASWGDARPIYELLIEFADGDRDIKQKARNIKAYHTRRENTRSKQVFSRCEVVQHYQSEQTQIIKPTFGAMYDIHGNEVVNAK